MDCTAAYTSMQLPLLTSGHARACQFFGGLITPAHPAPVHPPVEQFSRPGDLWWARAERLPPSRWYRLARRPVRRVSGAPARLPPSRCRQHPPDRPRPGHAGFATTIAANRAQRALLRAATQKTAPVLLGGHAEVGPEAPGEMKRLRPPYLHGNVADTFIGVNQK